MGKQVDQRIVEMRFENEKFEKNASTTLSTLDKLKEKLAFKKAGDGFDEIQKKADKVSFEHLIDSVDKLQDTLTHRTGIFGGMLEEIGSKIINVFTGALSKVQGMINQVTFDPIMTGLSEYELKINSVQVIAANTGVLMRDAMNEFGYSTKDADSAASSLYNTISQTGESTVEYIDKAYNAMNEGSETFTETISKSASVSSDVLQAAYDVMMGAYGNGAERRRLLGDQYDEIQGAVNELIWETGSVDAALNSLASNGYSFQGSMSVVQDSAYNAANTIETMTASMGDLSDAFDEMDGPEYTMEDIEAVLDALNLYADRTIYNYAQMTDAIGQFTVQGVDLYDANTAVQGLANLAAFTGVDATGAARVMREAAKGLATGYIGLQDWMSFETTGGMGGKVFQEQLLKTADQLWKTDTAYREYAINAASSAKGLKGKLDSSTSSITKFVNAQGRFRNSLNAGWINDTVLIETLHKFAGDLSDAEWAARGYTEAEIADIQALGKVTFEAATKAKTFHQMWDTVTEAAQSSWTTTWEYIFGTFYDARNLWTAVGDELSDFIGSMNDARNEALDFWANSPYGRENFLQGLANIWCFIKDVLYQISDAFHMIFGEVDGVSLVHASVEFERFTESLENLQWLVSVLVAVLTTFFAVIKIGLSIVGAFAYALGSIIGLDMPEFITGNLESIAWGIANTVATFAASESVFDGLVGVFYQLFDILKIIPMAIGGIAIGLNELSREFLGNSIIEIIGGIFLKIKEFITSFGGTGKLKEIGDSIKNFFSKIASAFSFKIDVANEAGTFKLIMRILAGLANFWLVTQALKLGHQEHDAVEFLESIPDEIYDVFDKIKDIGESITNSAKSGIIETIARSLVMLAISLGILSLIPVDRLQNATTAMIVLIAGVGILLKLLGGLLGVLPNNSMIMAAGSFALVTYGISALIGSLLVLNFMDIEKTVQSVVVIGLLIAMIAGLFKVMDHARFGQNSIKAAVAINFVTMAIGGLVTLAMILSLVVMFNSNGLWEAVGVIAALTGIIIVVAALAAGFSGKYNGSAIWRLSIALVPVGIAIIALGILAATLSAILAVPGNKLWEAVLMVGALSVVIMMITGFTIALAQGVTTVGLLNVVAIALVLPSVIIALSVIALACVALSFVPEANLYKAAGILATLMVFIYVLLDALGHINPGTFLSIFVLGKSLIVFLIFIGVLMGLVWMLSMTEFDVKRAITLFAGITAVLAALIIAIGFLGRLGGINKTVNQYFALGSGNSFARLLNSIAFLILSISVSLYLLTASLTKLMEAANMFTSDSGMQKKLTEMFVGIAQAFADSWEAIRLAVRQAGVSDTLEEWSISIIDHLVRIIARLGLGIVEVIGVLGETLIDSIIILLNKLAGTDLATWMDKSTSEVLTEIEGSPLTKIINAIVGLIALIIYGVADAIMHLGGPLVVAILYFFVAVGWLIWYVLMAIIALIAASFGDFDFSYLQGWMEDWDNLWENWWIETKGFWQKVGDWFMGPLASSLWEAILFIPYLLSKGVDLIGRAYYEYMKYSNRILDLPAPEAYETPAWAKGVIDMYEGLVDEYNPWVDIGGDLYDSIHAVSDETASSINQVSTAIDELSKKDVTISLTPSLAMNQDQLNSDMFNALNVAGAEGVKGFNAAWSVPSTAKEVTSPLSDTANGTSTVAEQVGTDIGTQIGTSAGESATESLVTSFKEGIANSELGKIGNDIKQKFSLNSIGSSLSSAFSPFGNVDLSTQPVLNLDTENIGTDLMGGTADFGQVFQGMFGNTESMNASLTEMGGNLGSVTTDMADVTSWNQTASEAIANENGKFYDDTQLVEEVSGLRGDLGVWSESIKDIKMYLDGDTLVGRLVTKIDEALARQMARNARGN